MANTHSLDLELSSSQHAYTADSAALSITQSFTVECWGTFESLSGVGITDTLAGKYLTTTNKRSYWFGLTNNSGTYELRGVISPDGNTSAGDDKRVAWTPSTSTYYHMVMVYDHTVPETRFYIGTTTGDDAQQGSSQANSSSSIHENDSRFAIGAIDSSTTPQLFHDGLIDEVRVWNVARSLTQINQLKYKQVISPLPNLVACYNLNNNYSDKSGNGQTLTAVNTPVFSTTIVTLTDFSTAKPLFFAQY